MYNNNDEMYEVSDFDEDVELRKELIEEAKNIDPSSDWNAVMRQISDLKRRWKRISYWESAYEEQLAEEFDGYLEVFYKKRREGFLSSQQVKEDLIAQAKKIANEDNFNKATEEMNQLMEQWKESGSAGKDTDDALWEEFNKARQSFFDRKHNHWEEMKNKFENALKVKEELIVKAASLADSEDWKKTSDEFKSLMDQWKAAGNAGREHDDRLWNEFNESRQKFYARRTGHYDQLHATQDQNYASKKALVDQAAAIVENKEFTKESTAKMKELQNEWKSFGSCGRDREDEIWSEFRTTMDNYFRGLKEWNEQKQTMWRQRMQEIRNRKQDMIQNQRRQISRMEHEMVGLLGQRAIDEMQEDIKDREEFIKELEAEIEEIDKKLAK